MNYGLLKSLLGVKQSIPMKAPSESFRCASKRQKPFIPPTFKKVVFESEKPTVLLVSAVGATGKTTLAQVLSHESGLPVLDLAVHKPVGDHTLRGLLTSAFDISQLTTVFQGLASGSFGLIVDGLDEGRSKTTEKAFHAFLDGVAELVSAGTSTAIVLLGRTITLEETWVYLTDKGVDVGLLSIEPFNLEAARTYIDSFSHGLESTHKKQYGDVRDFILERLGTAFVADGRKSESEFLSFIGYPPVLDAIVTLLEKERDFHGLHEGLKQRVDGKREIQLLDDIAKHILRREKDEKILPNILTPLLSEPRPDDIKQSVRAAFEPAEQCARLIASTMGRSLALSPISDTVLNERYERQLEPFLPEHPFLSNGSFRNVVFESYAVAVLVASGSKANSELVTDYFRTHKHSYYILYLLDLLLPDGEIALPIVPVVLGGALEFRSNTWNVTVNISGPDAEDCPAGSEVSLEIDIELTATGSEEPGRTFSFAAQARGEDEVRLGSRLASTYVNVPCKVAFDEAEELELTAPVEVSASTIAVPVRSLVLRAGASAKGEAAVVLEADDIRTRLETITTNGVDFFVSLSGDGNPAYPLVQYVEKRARAVADPLLSEKLRRARRILVEFRSHSKGELRRFRKKIENQRIIRNEVGRSVLDAFLRDRIVTIKGVFYKLEAEMLDRHLGMSWVDLMKRQTSDRFVEYLRRV